MRGERLEARDESEGQGRLGVRQRHAVREGSSLLGIASGSRVAQQVLQLR